MENIVNTMKEDIRTLKSDDVLIIWGGTNDIGKNNSKEAIRHLCTFIKNNRKVNTIVLTAPPRNDLPSSCINSEVSNYNRQLRRRLKQYNNIQILETNLERKYFTKHGAHLNSSGKEYITQRLAAVVNNFFHTKPMSPIHLQWKEDNVITNQYEINKDSLVTNNNDKSITTSQPLQSFKWKWKSNKWKKDSQSLK